MASVISRILRGSEAGVRLASYTCHEREDQKLPLTDEVDLTGPDIECDESDHRGSNGQGAENKSQSNPLGGLENTLDQQGEGKRVDCGRRNGLAVS